LKKLLIFTSSIIAAALIFTAGAFANEWLGFTGDDQVEQSGNDVDEIMDILRQVDEGKITAEEGLAAAEERIKELEDMNPSGLAKKNKELREQVSQLEGTITLRDNTIEGLESDLATANENYNGAVDRISELEGQLQNTPSQEYVEHLESELLRANEVVESHGNQTQEAVQEAREIGGE